MVRRDSLGWRSGMNRCLRLEPDRAASNALRGTRTTAFRVCGPEARGKACESRLRGTRMDAMELLKNDHEQVKNILEQLDSTTEKGVKTREELFTKFKSEMTVHERIEEEIFYPRLTEQAKTKEIALEGYEEHHVVDVVIGELDNVAYDDERWGAKFTVMKENIEHHIEEEEGEMFKLAKQALDSDELEELGERMEAMKKELQGQAT